MLISVLGCGGWMPSSGRETTSIMIRGTKTLLLLDAGTGISNLKAYEKELEEYDAIHVFLSHFHLDHTIGICYFCKWFKDKSVVFYLSKPTKGCRSGREILEDLLNPESFVYGLDQIAKSVKIVEYSEYVPFMAGEFMLEAKSQIHRGPCFAVKVDNKVCFATDTIADDTTFDWACGVKAIFHECWSIQKNNLGHTSFEELTHLANILEDGIIYLIHQNPDLQRTEYDMLCKSYRTLVTATDLMEIEV